MTCLVVTYTQKLLVAGYDNGHIILWDIPKKQVLKIISPLILEDMEKNGQDGHLFGHRIVHITFVGPKERFVSADEKVEKLLAQEEILFTQVSFYTRVMHSITSLSGFTFSILSIPLGSMAGQMNAFLQRQSLPWKGSLTCLFDTQEMSSG